VRIWLPLAILLSVAWLVLVAVVISRGGDGAGPTSPVAGDAATLLQQSQAAMLALDSLQADMTSSWEGREVASRVAWQSPDSFHILYPSLSVEYETGKDPVVTDYGLVEAIALGERMYTRQCVEEGTDCEPWGEGIRDGTYVPMGAIELDPMWTFELLGFVSEAQVVGQERVDGVECARIKGKAHVVQAMIESWRRAEEGRGPLYWGEECEGTPTEAGEYSQEQCHSLTLDEYIAGYEEDVRRQDENPPSVEVWIGRDDKLMHRLEIPATLAEESEGYFTFSRFDEVTVEPPK
jgi:hypothetical protein